MLSNGDGEKAPARKERDRPGNSGAGTEYKKIKSPCYKSVIENVIYYI